MKVLKFGGSSLGSPERIRRVVDVVRAAWQSHRVVVVASAVGRTTDALIEMVETVSAGGPSGGFVDGLRGAHGALARAVLPERLVSVYDETMDAILVDVREVGRDVDVSSRDQILATGERLSVPLLALALREAGMHAVPVDATRIVRTDETFGDARVEEEATNALVRSWYSELEPDVLAVVTGFLGASAGGRVTTLGRGGSDYSAALLARALDAEALERWTDVDGIYSADPRRDPCAVRLASIVLSDALAWNHAGKLGMHRKALDPVVDASIPVYVRSTHDPDGPGTVILPPRIVRRHAAMQAPAPGRPNRAR